MIEGGDSPMLGGVVDAARAQQPTGRAYDSLIRALSLTHALRGNQLMRAFGQALHAR